MSIYIKKNIHSENAPRHFVGMHTRKGSSKRTTGDSLKFTLLSGKNLRTLRQLSVVYIGSR